MSTSGTTGATPTPQSQPLEGSQVSAPVERTYVQTVETAKTETDKTVGQVFQQVTDTSNKTSFEAKPEAKPTTNRTNLSVKDLPPSDQKTHQLQEKNIDTTNIEERDDKELQAQREGRKESKKDDWLDLSDESQVPAGASVNTTATTLQTPTSSKEETSRVEASGEDEDMGLAKLYEGEDEGQVVHTSYDSSAPISERAQKRLDREQRKLEAASVENSDDSLGLTSMKITEVTSADKDLIEKDAHTQVYNKDKIAYVAVDAVQDTVSTRKVDPAQAKENEGRINHEIKHIFVTAEALGGLLPEQYKARLVDKGIVDDSYQINLISRFSKEAVTKSFNASIQFYTAMKEITQTLEAYRTPTHYDSVVGPRASTNKMETKEREQSGVAGERGAVTETGTGTAKGVQKMEEAARKQEHEIKKLQEEKQQLTQRKYELEKAYWERHTAAKAA